MLARFFQVSIHVHLYQQTSGNSFNVINVRVGIQLMLRQGLAFFKKIANGVKYPPLKQPRRRPI